MKNGEIVRQFETEFAQYVGAKFAVALVNGTATLHTALVALGVKPGDRVALPPLTMSSTTLAVLHAGATPVFRDVDPQTWLMHAEPDDTIVMPVELYGLQITNGSMSYRDTTKRRFVYDGAQALYRGMRYQGELASALRSYSFQASKILPTGEGGMLVTDDEALATKAREFSSLGYRLGARSPRIDPATLKSPTFERHHSVGYNYRMNDLTAAEGLKQLARANELLEDRFRCACRYADAIAGCSWITAQHVPENWRHDYWAFAIKVEDSMPIIYADRVVFGDDASTRSRLLAELVVKYGGERPYPAWRLTYHEPAFRMLHMGWHARPQNSGVVVPNCPNAESLQPRLLQLQTNDLASAERNAAALKKAIQEVGS